MTRRRRPSGHFELPIPASTAIGFFTPEGERGWAPGWDPTYPSGEPSETAGTVFVTGHGDTETVWVIEKIDREAHTSAYSRLTPGHHAGAVRVRCDDQPGGRCVVSVEYDMTALSPDDPQALDGYDDENFEAMMTEWATKVTAALPR
ncbi:MAG: hypothetical protein OEO77_05195 [Acidimicrobiia bacterium]|nr:hypothetical protein [Acidimicrobiia bacterium]